MTRALKWWIALGLVLAFLAGGTSGIFIGARHEHRRFAERHGGRMGQRMREHLKEQLNLTPEQVQAVDPILQDTAKRLQAIRQETAQRVTDTMADANRQLSQHLTPEQSAKLEATQERHLRMLHRRGRRPPLPPDAP